MATSKKQQTNESRLKKLIAENPPILNALLVERILKIMEITEEDIKENPQDWERSLIHPSLWHQLNNNVQSVLNS
jgi:chemotaxis signal transduction protein